MNTLKRKSKAFTAAADKARKEGRSRITVYHIQFQRRAPFHGVPGEESKRGNWRAWRQMSVWPKLFYSKAEADDAMHKCLTFQGLDGRKLSASKTIRSVDIT